jgi:hypothetical protein
MNLFGLQEREEALDTIKIKKKLKANFYGIDGMLNRSMSK